LTHCKHNDILKKGVTYVGKYIIFDAMGVIFTVGDDTNDLLVPYIWKKNPSITREEINGIYKDASLGKLTSEEFWKSVNVESTDKKYLDECLTIDESFIETAKNLKEKYKLAVLSNDLAEWSAYLRKKYGIDDVVEFSVISGDVGYRKPSKEIYEIALEKVNADPKDCIFIDDRDKNLLPAMKLGMNVIKFSREENSTTLDDVQVINRFEDLANAVDKIWHK